MPENTECLNYTDKVEGGDFSSNAIICAGSVENLTLEEFPGKLQNTQVSKFRKKTLNEIVLFNITVNQVSFLQRAILCDGMIFPGRIKCSQVLFMDSAFSNKSKIIKIHICS